MTATAKKTLSVLMAFVLVLGLMPLPGTVQRAAATEVVEKTEVDAGGLTDKTESGQGDESTLGDAPEQGRTPDQGQTAGKVSQPGLQPTTEPNPQPEKNSPEQTEPTKVEQATASAAKDTLSKEGKGEGSVKKADEDKGPEMTAMANPGDPVVVDGVEYSYTDVGLGGPDVVAITRINASTNSEVAIPSTLAIPVDGGDTTVTKTVVALKGASSNTTVGVGTLSSLSIPSSVNQIDRLDGTVSQISFKAGSALDVPAGAFEYVNGLTSITLPSGSIGAEAFKGRTSLASVTWPSGTTLGEGAFQGCSSLSSITLPSNLTTIGADAFNGTSLSSITIPDNVTTIGERAFANAPLTSGLKLGSSVQTIRADAFKNAQFTSIALPASLSTYYTNPTGPTSNTGTTAFSGCNKLQTITWPESGNFTAVGGFWDCPNLSSDTLSNLPTWITAIGDFAFSSSGSTSWTNIAIPNRITTIGTSAFEGRHFQSVTIPSSVTSIGECAFSGGGGTMTSLTIAAEGGALRIEERAFNGSMSYTTGVKSEGADEVVLPARVSYIGQSAFASSQYTSYRIMNKAIELQKSGSTVADPWDKGLSGTVYYPSNAAADSDIMKIKAYYEDPSSSGSLTFVPFEVEPPIPTHSIKGTVPAGASVMLSVAGQSYEPTLTTSGGDTTFTMPDVEEGVVVYAIVSMEGYLDYTVYPAMDARGKPTSTVMPQADWTFSVSTDDMTPLSTTGTLHVQAKGDYAKDCRMAVFTTDGKLVAQGKVVRAQLYTADALPADTYNVAAWQANDYFTQVSSLADFLKMGLVQDTDYAWLKGVQVQSGKSTTKTLTVPHLRTERIADMLSSGSVSLPTGSVSPGIDFSACISYEMAGSNKASSITVSLPEGIDVKQVYSATHAYSTGEYSFDAATRTLTVSTANADQASGRLWLRLQAAPASAPYTISAQVSNGVASVPIGSARIASPAIRLVVPEGALPGNIFDVAVFTAPETTVTFSIDGQPTGVTCQTNKAGRGTTTLTIPQDQITVNPNHTVTAAVQIAGQNYSTYELVSYSYFSGVVSPNVYEFYFTHSGSTVYLAREGKNLSGGYYLVLAEPSHNQYAFTPVWKFTATLESAIPLANTASLYLGMLDESTCYYDMQLTKTENAFGDVKRYTYSCSIRLGKPENGYVLGTSEIPYKFDIIPAIDGSVEQVVKSLEPTIFKDFGDQVAAKHAEMAVEKGKLVAGKPSDVFGEGAAASDTYESLTKDWAEWVRSITDDALRDKLAKSMGVFGYAYKHEVYDPSGTWFKSLTEDEKSKVNEAEACYDQAFEQLAIVLGDKKPLPAYASYEEYLKDNYGYETGQQYDKEQLRAEGYTIIENTDTAKLKGEWASYNTDALTSYNIDALEAPSWMAVKIEDGAGSGGSGLTTQSGPPECSGDQQTVTVKDSNGSSMSRTNDYLKGKILGAIGDTAGLTDMLTTVAGLVKDGKLATVGVSAGDIPALAPALKTGGQVCSYLGPIISGVQVYLSWDSTKKSVSEYEERKGELERIDEQIKWYSEQRGDGKMTLCEEFLRAERDALSSLVAVLWFNDWLAKGDFAMTGFGASAGTVSAVLSFTPAAEVGVGVGLISGAACLSWSGVSTAGNLVLSPTLDSWTNTIENIRRDRTRQCLDEEDERLKAFAKQHYFAFQKNTLIDPSGWVYAGVDDNRLQGVLATIYQKVGDAWVPWNADSYDQVNPQTTDTGGLFAWNVLSGVWKVLFQKEGYHDTWSDEMSVPPEWTKVAVNMLRDTAPAGQSYKLADDYSYVDITFDQYMKAGTVPTVTVGGVAVDDASWVNVTAGTDEAGNETQLALVLRVPLTDLAEPGIAVDVVVSGAYGYTGKPMTAPYTATIVIPDGSTYYYVAPDDTASFVKGSGKTLSFTFKRSAYDERTFPYFQGILVDGAPVGEENYTAAAGSVIVTLKADYLETLAEGDHVLTTQFYDGSATADFKVVAAEGAATKASASKSVPATGDRVASTGMLLLVACIACCVMLFARNRVGTRKPSGRHVRR